MESRKRARSDPGILPGVPQRPKNPLVGPQFVKAIDDITSAASTPVFTHVRIPFKYGGLLDKSFDLDLQATFSAKDHNSKKRAVAWSQGLVDGNKTSYEAIIPAQLTMEQSIAETRVMKTLAGGANYTPKTRRYKKIYTKAAMTDKVENWGRTSLQSYLEDVTGRLALNLQDVGSGMRATFLASKMRMKTNATTSEAGFQDEMYKRFPQLLTKSKPSKKKAKAKTATVRPVGGASHYNEVISKEIAATGASATQEELRDKVRSAHYDVNREGRKRFNYKWQEIEAGRMTTTQAGKWWTAKFGANNTGAGTLQGKGGMDKRSHRRAYVANKLPRHDITRYV